MNRAITHIKIGVCLVAAVQSLVFGQVVTQVVIPKTVPPVTAVAPTAIESPTSVPVEAPTAPVTPVESTPATPTDAAAAESSAANEFETTAMPPEDPPGPELYPDPPNIVPEPTLPEPDANGTEYLVEVPVYTAKPEPVWRFSSILNGGLKAYYDSNVDNASKDEKSDLIISLSAGVTLGWGNYKPDDVNLSSFNVFNRSNLGLLNLASIRDFYGEDDPQNFLFISYSPTYSIYLDGTTENELDHAAALEGRLVLKKIIFDLRLHFQSLSDVETDVGTRTRRNIYRETLETKYEVTDKTSFTLTLSYTAYDYEDKIDSQEAVAKLWADYKITPRISLGVGVVAGQLEVEDSADQTYEQLAVRGSWKVLEKVFVRGEVGIEQRHLDDGDETNPAFTLGAIYTPFDGTRLAVDFSQRIRSSAALPGSNYETTSLTVRLRQRVLNTYYFNARAGLVSSDYSNTQSSASTNREDKYAYGRVGFEVQALKRCSVEVYYQYQHNDSNDDQYGYTVTF